MSRTATPRSRGKRSRSAAAGGRRWTTSGSTCRAGPSRGCWAQAPSVCRDLSIEDNVRRFAAVQDRDRRAVAEPIGAVGLTGIGGRRVADLSGGQFSRVSPACSLVGRPSRLVLDEPTVGLGPVLRAGLGTDLGVDAASVVGRLMPDSLALRRRTR